MACNSNSRSIFQYKSFSIKIDNIIVFFSLIITFLSGSAIAHGDTTLFNESERRIYAYVIFISLVILLLLVLIYKKYCFSSLIFIPFFYCVFSLFDVYGNTIPHVIDTLYMTMRLLSICILTPNLRIKLFKLYRQILIIFALIGIVCYLWYLAKLPGLYNIVDYYTGSASGANYVDFKICYLFVEGSSVRLCCLFNEPGYLGTIIALILCAERFNIKKIGNVILLLAGICSLSVAFILILLIYFFILMIKKPKIFILMLALVLIYFFALPLISKGNGALATLADRMIIKNNSMTAAQRSNIIIDETVNKLFTDGKALFGYGDGYVSSLSLSGISTYKTYIINFGYLGFLLIFGTPFIIILRKSKMNIFAIAFLIAFFCSVYQRPDIFTMPYILILLGGVENILKPMKCLKSGSPQ